MPRDNPTIMAGRDILPGLSLAITVRPSKRARNMTLRMLPGRGLEIVVPVDVGQREIVRLLENKREWIERTAARMSADGVDLSGALPALPEELALRAVGRALPLSYAPRKGNLLLRENAGRLVMSGPVDEGSDHARAFKRLRQYVRDQARIHLPPRLRDLSRTTGMAFDEVQIRCQRTRWGSCAVKGRGKARLTRISLNAKLLFLPPALCDQVLLHELCHLVHQDHSPAYWALVERFNPDARKQERELSAGYRWVPAWWDRSF